MGAVNSDAVEAQINSEVKLLQSTDLMEGLVRYRDQELRGIRPPEEGTIRMAQELLDVEHRLEVNPLRKTNLIEVTFKDADPYYAKKSLKWLSTAFLDKHAELRRPAGAYRFFETKTKELESQVHEAEAALVDFQRANALVSVGQEKVLTLDNLNLVSREINALKADLRESESRLASGRTQVEDVNGRITTQVRNTPNQYSSERLETLLVDLGNRRTQLLTRYLASDRLVKEIDEQIASTQAALTEARTQSTVETTSDNNPIRTTLEEDLRKTKIHADGEAARVRTLEQQAAQLSARLDTLQRIGLDNDSLERRVQDLKQNRDTYAQKRDQADIDDELDRKKIVDVAVAQEPTLSVLPVQPHRMMALVLGVLLASFASLGYVLMIDAFRGSAFTPAELEAMTGCPVLATFPERRLAKSGYIGIGDARLETRPEDASSSVLSGRLNETVLIRGKRA
jgi:uncharacterized protein involved in exopolysaccharide biosynthesis